MTAFPKNANESRPMGLPADEICDAFDCLKPIEVAMECLGQGTIADKLSTEELTQLLR